MVCTTWTSDNIVQITVVGKLQLEGKVLREHHTAVGNVAKTNTMSSELNQSLARPLMKPVERRKFK